MGQYYRVINVDTMQGIDISDTGCGIKLMEHSYIDTKVCNIVETLLCKGNPWYKTKVIWSGDYGSNILAKDGTIIKEEDFANEKGELDETSYKAIKNLVNECIIHLDDKGNVTDVSNLYFSLKEVDENGLESAGLFKDVTKYLMTNTNSHEHTIGRYIINHTKKLYVDKYNLPKQDEYGFIIHPLPILLADSNGRGGGDYHPRNKEEEKLVGSWVGDIISMNDRDVLNEKNDKDEYVYKELIVSFSE